MLSDIFRAEGKSDRELYFAEKSQKKALLMLVRMYEMACHRIKILWNRPNFLNTSENVPLGPVK